VALGREAERDLGRRADLLDLAGEAARPGWLTVGFVDRGGAVTLDDDDRVAG
jgi:hypothetical protein